MASSPRLHGVLVGVQGVPVALVTFVPLYRLGVLHFCGTPRERCPSVTGVEGNSKSPQAGWTHTRNTMWIQEGQTNNIHYIHFNAVSKEMARTK